MATKEAKLQIVVDAQNRTQGAFNSLQQNLDGVKKSYSGLQSVMTAVGTAGVAAFGGLSLLSAGIVKAGADFEQTQIAFETMLGSAELAKQTLQELSQFAATTPFELTQLEEASKRLLAYGLSAEELLPTLRMLGDISAGVGMDKLPQLILAFGQVRAATKLTGMELRQFSEAGVPLLGALVDQFNAQGGVMRTVEGNAEKVASKMESLNHTLEKQNNRLREMRKNGNTASAAYKNLKLDIARTEEQLAALPAVTSSYSEQVKVTAADVLDMVSAGEVTYAQVQEALTSMTAEGGRFNDLMLRQSASLAGLWSNFKDQLSLTARAIGEELLPYLKPLAERLIEVAKAVGTFVSEHPRLSAFMLMAALGLAALMALLLPLAIALPGLIVLFGALGTVFGVVTAMSAPLLLAFGAVAAGLAILISQGYLTRQAWQDVWLGIKLITADAANAVIAIAESMVNMLLENVNRVIRAINAVIAAAQKVPGIGKKLSSLSEIKAEFGSINPDIIAADDIAGRSNPFSAAAPVLAMSGNVFLSEDVAERIGDLILGKLKLSNQM